MSIEKKVIKAAEKGRGLIVCLNEKEKTDLKSKGFKVEEVETPCGAKGHQTVTI